MTAERQTNGGTRSGERIRALVCLLVVASGLMLLLRSSSLSQELSLRREVADGIIKVAFVGNSMMYVNDLPRLMEAMSGFVLLQDSCLHGSLNLASILRKGNGMYGKSVEPKSPAPPKRADVWDLGACTVAQLLLGHDPNLQPTNANGYYVNDGTNPCFVNASYYEDRQNATVENHTACSWDFVVLNDRTTYPGVPRLRNLSVAALLDSYTTYFLITGATPVLYMTYTYPAQASIDIPEFTSRVLQGNRRYATALADVLPPAQRPILAPVGIAFLVLWEENFGLWERLFDADNVHPSPHGTYLIGCVLYASMHGKMPLATAAVPANVRVLWDQARWMQIDKDGDAMPFPTQAEANFLYLTAKRVVLEGYWPRSFPKEVW